MASVEKTAVDCEGLESGVQLVFHFVILLLPLVVGVMDGWMGFGWLDGCWMVGWVLDGWMGVGWLDG